MSSNSRLPGSLYPSVVIAISLVVGCGSKAHEQMCRQSAELNCKFLHSCCNASERAQLLDHDSSKVFFRLNDLDDEVLVVAIDGEDSESSCVEKVITLCVAAGQATSVAEQEGRVTLEVDKFKTCLEPLQTAVDACDATAVMNFNLSASPECRDLVVGTVAAGGACYESFECSAGSTCEIGADPVAQPMPAPQTRTLQGKCSTPVALPKQNEPCPMALCEGNLLCLPDMMGTGRCTRPLEAGAACANSNIPCDLSLGLECVNGTCQAPAGVTVTHDYCKGGD